MSAQQHVKKHAMSMMHLQTFISVPMDVTPTYVQSVTAKVNHAQAAHDFITYLPNLLHPPKLTAFSLTTIAYVFDFCVVSTTA